MSTRLTLLAGVVAVSAAVGSAHAAPTITNGSFSSSSYTSSTEFGPAFGGQGVTGWTSSLSPGPSGGFNTYWFLSDVAAGHSAANRFGDPGNILPSIVTASPDGGNFVALDGDTNYNGYLYQTVTGLTAGAQYDVSFDWAGAQLLNRTGATTDSLAVSFGNGVGTGQTITTTPVSVATHGFSGWMQVNDIFTATGTSDILTFLSIGTPSGLPPVALLDGVSIAAVPEPASLALLAVGMVGVGLMYRRSRGQPRTA